MTAKKTEQKAAPAAPAVPAPAAPPVPETPPAPDPIQQDLENPGPPEIIQQFVDVERGGVAWCELFGKKADEAGVVHLVKINVTQRDTDAISALRGLLAAIQVAKTEFKLNPYQPTFETVPAARPAQPPAQSAPALAPAAAPAPAAASATAPAAPAAPAAPQAPASPAPAAEQVLQVVKVDVKPRADGKVTLDLFAAGRKFADLHMTGTPEQLAAQFGGGWTPAHFGPNLSASYPVSLKVYWVNSARTNSQGNPYKDVTRIAA